MKSMEPPNDTVFFFLASSDLPSTVSFQRLRIGYQPIMVRDQAAASGGNVHEIIASKPVIAGETAMMPSLFTDHGPPSMSNTFPPASSIHTQIPVS